MKILAMAILVASMAAAPAASAEGNVLLIILDDVGVEQLACYNRPDAPAYMPFVNAQAAQGTVFENVWACPSCTPTRASMATGRYPYRHGLGWPRSSGDRALALTETTFAALARNAPAHYATGLFGKWHLSDGKDDPGLLGWDQFLGTLQGGLDGYFNGILVNNGRLVTFSNTYITTTEVNAAVRWVQSQGDRPWFLQLALNAPHTPLHAPPDDLINGSPYELLPREWALPSRKLAPRYMDDVVPENREIRIKYYRAMLYSVDKEIARLCAQLGDRLNSTTVIIVGDNGTPDNVVAAGHPANHYKQSLYNGGIQVPLIAWGPGVQQGARCSGFVHVVDFFPTIAELTGASIPADLEIDGVSFASLLHNPGAKSRRRTLFTEQFGTKKFEGADGKTARIGRYKLIRFDDNGDGAREEAYDVVADPDETTDIIERLASRLPEKLANLRSVIDNLGKKPIAGKACEPSPDVQ